MSAARRQVVDAILADSVRTGHRTGIYTMLYAAGILSLAGGQLVAAGIFALAGNRRASTNCASDWCRWDLHVMWELSKHAIDQKPSTSLR